MVGDVAEPDAVDAIPFLGEHRHTLDPKGRVILPSAFRERLGEGLVMTMGPDNCLTVYPVDGWREVLGDLRNLRSTDRRERMFTRMMTSSAHPEVPDRQGRVTIPARLRAYAGLTKDVILVGADAHVEVWDSAAWDRYRDAAMDDFASTGEPFGIGRF